MDEFVIIDIAIIFNLGMEELKCQEEITSTFGI